MRYPFLEACSLTIYHFPFAPVNCVPFLSAKSQVCPEESKLCRGMLPVLAEFWQADENRRS
jgi:hypothetical protein